MRSLSPLRTTLASALLLTLGWASVAPVAASAVVRSPGLTHVAPAATLHAHGHRQVFETIPALRKARAAYAATHRAQAHASGAKTLSARGGINGIETLIGTPQVYVVFYGSQWGTETTTNGYDTFSNDPSNMAPYLQAMYAGLGTDGESWSGVLTQYCNGVASGTTTCSSSAAHIPYPSQDVLAGVWYDNSVASLSNTTGNTLATEAEAAAGHFNNTTSALNRNTMYIIVSPTGTHPDGFNTASANFCAYHDYSSDSSLTGGAAASTNGVVDWTNMPYLPDMGASCGANFVNSGTGGALDGVSIVAGHEYAETMTDELPAGGWYNNTYGETGDICAWISPTTAGGAGNVVTATGTFAMQGTWSNSNNACELSDPTVTGQPFSVSLSASTATVQQGATATATVSTAASSGTPTIALSATGAPTGATATLSTSSVTAGGTSTLSVVTSPSTPTGVYPIVVTGTSNAVNETATYTLTVVAPSTFTLSASPVSGSVGEGSSLSTTIATATTAGSAQTVAFTATGLPTGVTASFSPTSVTSGASTTLKLTASSTATVGAATITVTGTGATYVATTTYALTVTAPVPNAFSLSLTPTSGSVSVGSKSTVSVATAVTSGSAQTVALTATGLPTGVTAALSPTSVTTGASSTLTLTAGVTAVPGTYTVTVTGKATSGSVTATYGLTIVASTNAFTLTATPSSGTVKAGSSIATTIATATSAGSAQTVKFTTSTLPSGVTASFSSSSVTSGGSTTLTLRTSSRVTAGTYTITITGTGTSSIATTTYTLTD